MPASQRGSLAEVQFAGSSAVVLDQITNYGLSPNVSTLARAADGEIDPRQISTDQVAPQISFTTTKCGTALALIGLNGLFIQSTATYTALNTFIKKAAQGSHYASGSAHTKIAGTMCLVVPQTLTIPARGGRANVSFMAYFVSPDLGTNAALSVTASQALPGGNALAEEYILGKVVMDTAALNDLQQVTVNFGNTIEVSADPVGGSYRAVRVNIRKREPVVTIQTMDPDVLAAVDLEGEEFATDTVIYLRKLDPDTGKPVADATEAHSSLTIAKGNHRIANANGAHGGWIGPSLEVRPAYDGTDPIWAWASGVAIP